MMIGPPHLCLNFEYFFSIYFFVFRFARFLFVSFLFIRCLFLNESYFLSFSQSWHDNLPNLCLIGTFEECSFMICFHVTLKTASYIFIIFRQSTYIWSSSCYWDRNLCRIEPDRSAFDDD